MTERSVKVAAIQVRLRSESSRAREINLKRAIELMNDAVSMNVDVICLPELFLGAGTVEEWSSPTVRELCDFARGNSVYVIPNLYIHDEEGKFSASPLINRKGEIVGVYKKTHLFPWEYRFTKLKLGSDLPVFDTEFGKIGILICQDAMVPEAPRVMALKGAEILFVQSRMPGPFLVPWRDVMRVRAIENQVYLVSVGGAGYDAIGTVMVAPRLVNDVIVEAGREEQVVTATLDLEWLREVRKRENQPLYYVNSVEDMRRGLKETLSYTFPLDRNPKLYSKLVEPYDPTEF